MPKHLKLQSAKAEVNGARNRHLQMLADVRRHCMEENPTRDGFRYLMAIPMIYAAWEGYFKIACSICFQRKCVVGRKAKSYPGIYATLWLQKQGFVQAYLQKLFNAMQLGREAAPKTGAQYRALAQFSTGLADWLEGPIDHTIGFDGLVMTYSNVDIDVFKLNAEIIGLDLNGVMMGRLNELVGRRNEIAHGGLVTYPAESEVDGLIIFTENLIKSVDVAISAWLPGTRA